MSFAGLGRDYGLELLKFYDDIYGPRCVCSACGAARYDCVWPLCDCFPELYPLVEVEIAASPSCPWCWESVAQPDPVDAGWWICPCGKHFGAEDES